MKRLFLMLFLTLFTIALIPMVVRKSKGKETSVSLKLVLEHVTSFSDNSNHIQDIKDNIETLKTITADGYQFGDGLKAIYNLLSVAINVILVPFDFIFFIFDTFNWYISVGY